MLLRSSSTPVFGTLLPSFSDNPKKDLETSHSNNSHIKHPTQFDHHSVCKPPLPHGVHNLRLTSNSRNSYPVSYPASRLSVLSQESSGLGLKAFQRAPSDGNLGRLSAYHSCYVDESDELSAPKKISSFEQLKKMFQTESSCSIYNSNQEFKDEENEPQEVLKRTIAIEGSIEEVINLALGIRGDDEEKGLTGIQNLRIEEDVEPASPPMYIPGGLGINAADFGGGGFHNGNHVDISLTDFDRRGDAKEYCKRMLVQRRTSLS
ncbi:Signal transduction response regulator [Quillaja saponaria]|uniref:Signal transduction response regulator n=1 Tax=Quillaja saponaria TaxID=32244 RepID=A0AAD7QE28_QUISA|nr:Signal transduction response regulator [Quillaja saponaria]